MSDAERITRDHPDFDAVRARAFAWVTSSGWLTAHQAVEAIEAGKAALRTERAVESQTGRAAG